MDVGLCSSNYSWVINMTAFAGRLGIDICNSLLGIHVSTRCDFTAALMHKGKVYPFQLMVKSIDFVYSFGRLRESGIRMSLIQLKNFSVKCTTYPQSRRSMKQNSISLVSFMHCIILKGNLLKLSLLTHVTSLHAELACYRNKNEPTR